MSDHLAPVNSNYTTTSISKDLKNIDIEFLYKRLENKNKDGKVINPESIVPISSIRLDRKSATMLLNSLNILLKYKKGDNNPNPPDNTPPTRF